MIETFGLLGINGRNLKYLRPSNTRSAIQRVDNKIATKKMPDLNAKDLEGAMRIIEGTARQMGIEVKE